MINVLLPGRDVPSEFDHRARGNSLTVPHSGFVSFKVCLVISRNPRKNRDYVNSQLLSCRIFGKDDLYPIDREFYVGNALDYRAEHLFIFHSRLLDERIVDLLKSKREIRFEFSNTSSVFDIIECGAKIWTQQNIKGSYESGLEQVLEDEIELEPSEAFEDDVEPLKTTPNTVNLQME
ncbi:unnamed protein product [Thlaspi arvense]|uniref:Uncharacterized protein n=1 Tax=Thlaspi arvense TaxID=13288 RepID=A0AAU9RQC3_THLAR|nr:unnamed protein product [Thlaspi arvense]